METNVHRRNGTISRARQKNAVLMYTHVALRRPVRPFTTKGARWRRAKVTFSPLLPLVTEFSSPEGAIDVAGRRL